MLNQSNKECVSLEPELSPNSSLDKLKRLHINDELPHNYVFNGPKKPICASILKSSRKMRRRKRTTYPHSLDPRIFLKASTLITVPLVAYYCNHIVPSFSWFLLAVFCFVKGMLDILDQEPTIASTNLSDDRDQAKSFLWDRLTSKTFGMFNGREENDHHPSPSVQKRQRRVQFAEGTKFYRLPKPMSRRQKAIFCKQRFQYPHVASARKRKASHSKVRATEVLVTMTSPPPETGQSRTELPDSTFYPSISASPDNVGTGMHDSSNLFYNVHDENINWEDASARLKSAILLRNPSDNETQLHTTEETNLESIKASKELTLASNSADLLSKLGIVANDSAPCPIRLTTLKPLKESNR